MTFFVVFIKGMFGVCCVYGVCVCVMIFLGGTFRVCMVLLCFCFWIGFMGFRVDIWGLGFGSGG